MTNPPAGRSVDRGGPPPSERGRAVPDPEVAEPVDPPVRFAHQPALDGLRGLAVLAVVLFHAQVSWLHGGYVGVSVFFTLSGFLITSLLIGEHARTGRVDALAFYGRRIRRLLPASVLCLVAVAAVAAAGGFDGVAHLRRDTVGAALQVFNWVKLAGGGSYASLFAEAGGRVGPLDHYWSLAIEEQFYWVWPLAFLGLATVARRGSRSLAAVLAVPAVAFVALAPVIARVWGPDAAYWATPARVGEILTGTVAAALVAEGRVPRWARWLGPPCLAAIVAASVLLPASHGPAYQGWLPLGSLASVGLVLALQSPGPLARALAWRPLALLGTVSYGVYLFHWPLFALLDEDRLDRTGAPLLAVRLAATLAAAVLSYVLLERPVRRSRPRTAVTFGGGLAATAVALAVVLVIPPAAPDRFTAGVAATRAAAIDPDVDLAPLRTLAPATDPAPPFAAGAATPVRATAPTPSRPVRIVVAGDSTAEVTGAGLVEWAAAHPDLAQVTLVTAVGCGFTRGGTRIFATNEKDVESNCAPYVDHILPDAVGRLRPDVVMVLSTSWDVIDQRWGAGGPVESPLDADYRRRIDRGYAAVTEDLLAEGAARVVWLREPVVQPYWMQDGQQSDPARHAVVHAAIERLATADPARVRVADLAGWVTAAGLDDGRDARPDGVHWSKPVALRLASDWLGPLLVTEALR